MPLSIPSFYSRIRVWRKCWLDRIVTSAVWRWSAWSMGSGSPAERRRPGWSQALPPPLLVRLLSTPSLPLLLLLHPYLHLRCLPLVCRRILLCPLVITWWSEAIMWLPSWSLWVSSLTTCITTTIRLFNITILSCHIRCISRKMYLFNLFLSQSRHF